MPRRRESREEQSQRREMEKTRYWKEDFHPKLKAINTPEDAKVLLAQWPQQDTPARELHANFHHFFHHFTPPLGATGKEKSAYIEILARFDEGGHLVPGVRQRVEASLAQSIKDSPF